MKRQQIGAVCLAAASGVLGYVRWATRRSARQLACQARPLGRITEIRDEKTGLVVRGVVDHSTVGFSLEDLIRTWLIARDRERRMARWGVLR